MALTLKEFTKLKERVDSLQSQADRSAGAYEQLKTQLKKDYDCDTLKKAKKLLATLEEEASTLESEYKTALDKFEKEWSGKLEKS